MNNATRQLVRARARERCEYCRLPQHSVDFTFHVEHVVARQHGGSDVLENLALACDRCNLYKGPNIAGIDPSTGGLTPLFNPRADDWKDHFAIRGNYIMGLTPTGRATVGTLNFNAAERRQAREALISRGDF